MQKFLFRLISAGILLLPSLAFGQIANSTIANAQIANAYLPPAAIVTNFNDLIFNPLGSSTATTSATSYTGPTISPSTNSLVLIAVSNTKGTAADQPTSVTGNNLTYVLVTNVTCGTSATNMLTIWRGQGANPTSGSVSVSFGANTETSCNVQAIEVQGADATAANGAGAIVQVQTNGVTAAATNPTISYTTPSAIATNALVWFVMDNVNDTTSQTPSTNWVRYAKIAHGTRIQGLGTHFQMNGLNSASATITATSRAWGGALVEIKPALEADPTSRPTLVQYVCSSHSQPATTPPWITNIFFNLPNLSLAGNLLSMHVTSFQGAVPTVADDKGNTWSLAGSTVSGGMLDSVLYATNIAANTLYITITFNTNTAGAQYDCGEYANVLKYQPLDTYVGAGSTWPAVADSSLATHGDGELIIYNAIDIAAGGFAFGNTITGFRSYGTRFLATAAFATVSSGYAVQAKGGAWTPAFDISSTGGDGWVNGAVAYKRAPTGGSGTLPSTSNIRILRLQETLFQGGVAVGGNVYVPMDGNLMVGSVNGFGRFDYAVTNISDVLGNTWSKYAITNNGPQIFWVSNSIVRQNPPNILTVNRNLTGGNPNFFLYDIVNASAYPLGAAQETNTVQTTLNGPIANTPQIFPVQGSDLIINCVAYGIGPASTETPGIYDSPYWWGQTDNDTFAGGDSFMHYFNPDTTAVAFTVNMTNQINNSTANGLAIEFKHK